ncbi:MAG TPA: DUF883 family protein [Burkholderiales bacterium]|nr:DUF883 family protein [Burkholderiales bacterium]
MNRFMESPMKTEITTDKLMEDLRLVVSDAEELVKATAGQAGEKVSNARARAEESIRAAKAGIADAGQMAAEHTREAAKAADDYVRENPWTAVGIAAGVGILIGVLISRK